GIRDRNVTGVQTCALPISVRTVVQAPALAFSLARRLHEISACLGTGLGKRLLQVFISTTSWQASCGRRERADRWHRKAQKAPAAYRAPYPFLPPRCRQSTR